MTTRPTIEEPDFERLRQTRTFRDDGFERWQLSRIGIVGAGTIGQRLACEATMAGTRVSVWDFDVGQPANRGTQRVESGVPKVDTVLAACAAIRPGRATGAQLDIRQVGVGELQNLDVLIDCTDDPGLAVYMTKVSSGLRLPLLRLAIDGSGAMDTGRVLCSHGGAGYSCQMCTYDTEALFRYTPRTPCPNQQPLRSPTRAGGPLSAAIAAMGLLQAQRLVTGNDIDQVLDLEVILDMTHWQLFPVRRQRAADCLSGHGCWRLDRLPRAAADCTIVDLFQEAARRFRTDAVILEPFGNPLYTEATCACGGHEQAVGTRWAPPPTCQRCRLPMTWLQTTARPRLTRAEAATLRIERTSLVQLGFPRHGGLFTAQAPNLPPLTLVLEQRSE